MFPPPQDDFPPFVFSAPMQPPVLEPLDFFLGWLPYPPLCPPRTKTNAFVFFFFFFFFLCIHVLCVPLLFPYVPSLFPKRPPPASPLFASAPSAGIQSKWFSFLSCWFWLLPPPSGSLLRTLSFISPRVVLEMLNFSFLPRRVVRIQFFSPAGAPPPPFEPSVDSWSRLSPQ